MLAGERSNSRKESGLRLGEEVEVDDVVEYWPAAAAQPIKGGMPPTSAPTQVFSTERRLRGV